MARKKASAESASPSFEVALDQLEKTVVRLESGELPLEEALELFESGVKLSRQCNDTLEAAQRRVEILVAGRAGDGEQMATEDFDSDDGDDDFEDDSEDSED